MTELEKIIRIEDVEGANCEGYSVITDKQTIKVSINNQQDWCESWGYFWCNEKPDDFIGASVTGLSIVDDALNKTVFDAIDDMPMYEGGIMFVNIETDKGVLQFVAYNEHNGYYSHEAKVESEQLKHEEYL